MRTEQGFTLVELLITVVVLSILVALAVPNFRGLMDRNAVVTQANDLISGILLARSEAIKRELPVVIRQVGSWNTQWIVFNDLNGNNNYNSATEAPRILNNQQTANSVTITGANNAATFIRFNSRGRATMAPGEDSFTITRNSSTRYICFSATGRPRVQEDPSCQ